MTVYVAPAAKANRPAVAGPVAQGGLVCVPFVYAIGAPALTNADFIKLCKLPKQTVPIDLVIDWPDLDSGTALVYDVGLYADDAGDAAMGTLVDVDAFIAGGTAARAVGRERVANALQAAAAAVLAASDSDRIVAVDVSTSATGAGAGGTIRGYLLCRYVGHDG